MLDCQQLRRDQLIVGAWYVGRGRNADIGMWDGEDFLVLAKIGKKIGPGRCGWESFWDIIDVFVNHDITTDLPGPSKLR